MNWDKAFGCLHLNPNSIEAAEWLQAPLTELFGNLLDRAIMDHRKLAQHQTLESVIGYLDTLKHGTGTIHHPRLSLLKLALAYDIGIRRNAAEEDDWTGLRDRFLALPSTEDDSMKFYRLFYAALCMCKTGNHDGAALRSMLAEANDGSGNLQMRPDRLDAAGYMYSQALEWCAQDGRPNHDGWDYARRCVRSWQSLFELFTGTGNDDAAKDIAERLLLVAEQFTRLFPSCKVAACGLDEEMLAELSECAGISTASV